MLKTGKGIYMKRDIIEAFKEWKERKNRKVLIVRGARQVGKTYSIEYFANKYFNNYITVNLEEKPGLQYVFKQRDPHFIVNELSVLYKHDIVPGKTLLFIDEIQESPEAIRSLRYFYEKIPGLHVIAAGSLLDHTLRDINYPMPVGRIEFLYMYPLSFKEFLMALGYEKLLSSIKEYYFSKTIKKAIHLECLKLLRLFFFIGGMPEVVKTYYDTQKLFDVERIQNNIVTAFQYDFSKYGTKKQQDLLRSVFHYCARNIGKKVKYSKISHDIRSSEIKEAFERLNMSRIIHLIRYTKSPGLPLTEMLSDRIFKSLFLDIGLANNLSGIKLPDTETIMIVNEGALAEQFIGQELFVLNESFKDACLFYWIREEKNSHAEIDYLYQHHNRIIPVEVKAGKSGSLKSLHVYLFEKKAGLGIRFNQDIPSKETFKVKVRTGKGEGEIKYTLISLPLYMCFMLPGLLEKML